MGARILESVRAGSSGSAGLADLQADPFTAKRRICIRPGHVTQKSIGFICTNCAAGDNGPAVVVSMLMIHLVARAEPCTPFANKRLVSGHFNT